MNDMVYWSYDAEPALSLQNRCSLLTGPQQYTNEKTDCSYLL